MATVVLVRHGRTTANAAGVLAGRTPGVALDAAGHEQAERVAGRLAGVPLVAAVSSPLRRCRETARHILQGREALPLRTDQRLVECDYGAWQGRPLKELAKERLWQTVQQQPSAARFPEGESLLDMSQRVVAAVREIDAALTSEYGDGAIWVAISHGDLVKAVVADAMGAHLDMFQRIQADPASATIIRYTPARPYLLGVNTHAGDLSWLVPAASSRRRRRHDAVVGGGAGPERTPPATA